MWEDGKNLGILMWKAGNQETDPKEEWVVPSRLVPAFQLSTLGRVWEIDRTGGSEKRSSAKATEVEAG